MHYAALSRNFEGCELFLKAGINVNSRSNQPDACTPLGLVVSFPALFYSNYENERRKTVEILLEYGANIDDKTDGRSILEVASWNAGSLERQRFGNQNLSSYVDDIRYVFMRHVAKMDCMNLRITENDRQAIERYSFYKGYYESCADELRIMKNTIIHNNVSVFNILMDSEESISRYAENEELVAALERKDYDNEFPI